MFAYLTYRAGSYFSRVLPWKLPEAIAWTIGQFSCLFRRGTRRNLEANLQIVYGGSLSKRERRRMSRRVVMNFSRAILVFLKLPTYEWESIRAKVDMSALEGAIAELGERPSFLLAAPHLGPYELAGLCLSRMGYKIHTVALDHPTKQVTRFFDQRRRQIGVISYPMRGSYSLLKEALLAGDVVALLVDRAYGATAKRFEFFGVKARFPLGHLFLSASAGVPIVTGAFVFDGSERFKWIHGGCTTRPARGPRILTSWRAFRSAACVILRK